MHGAALDEEVVEQAWPALEPRRLECAEVWIGREPLWASPPRVHLREIGERGGDAQVKSTIAKGEGLLKSACRLGVADTASPRGRYSERISWRMNFA